MDEVLQLRRDIWNQMPEQSWFSAVDREEYEHTLQHGFGLLCMVGDQIAAVCMCLLEETDYSHDIYEATEDIEKCADYSDTFVHPDYQGNGLQHILEQKMEELCKKAGKTILLGTVHPDNQYSYRNFIRSGYRKVARLKKYGGLDRFMMEKRLEE